jgi:cytochrome bd-type quinol oxidase subunit 1
VYGVLRTNDTVTPMPNLWVPLVVFTVVYLVLAGVVAVTIRRHVAKTLV